MALLNDVLTPSRILNSKTRFKTTIKEWPNGRTSAKKNWANPLTEFDVEFDGITLVDFGNLKQFFVDNAGQYGVFRFRDTNDNVIYDVRFGEDVLQRKPIRKNVRGLYKIRIKLKEVKQ